ncbi:SecY-interacting protein [Pseudoalteromonas luteoviolacea]|uniref:SecY-interacting protein n=1 Tax=Pseudoalteromonas luteoviolacea TaxID=43657 RepID=A0A1C0TJY7_9GAMM|nr:SecY-interacting protein [Pseudoalteromonas luteoviolacea]OCQ18434.1 SecY-interacting protein [Pseudoalteromonas luteoviolacea]
MASVTNLMAALHKRYASSTQQNLGHLPLIQHDADYPSPCEIGQPDAQGQIQWQAISRTPTQNLDDLAKALETEFPAALHAFYGVMFGGNILTQFDGNDVELLQVWNDEDFINLQQNITGHVLMKRRLKQDDTVFIGLTEKEDLLITVKLKTGEVCLEYVGKPPHHVLAASLEEFIKSLSF